MMVWVLCPVSKPFRGPNRMACVRLLVAAVALAGMVFVEACTHDLYHERVDALERHASAFRGYVEVGAVQAATRENVQIEALAAQLSIAISKRSEAGPVGEHDQDRVLYETATKTAVKNWLALAGYFFRATRYEEARTTYHHVLDMYTARRYQPFRAQAKEGLRGLEAIEGNKESEQTSSSLSPQPNSRRLR